MSEPGFTGFKDYQDKNEVRLYILTKAARETK
jgi:hypothetical protein